MKKIRASTKQFATSSSPSLPSRRTFLRALGAMPVVFPGAALSARANGRAPRPGAMTIGSEGATHPVDFYSPSQLTLMVGFIKDPQHRSFTVQQWAKDVGKNFDARRLVADAQSSGMVDIIWYDKWIDGLVFHKTQTTHFATERDFLADLAPECQRARLKLIIYFNVFFDGNPEFAQWACTDQRGNPITFAPIWPANQMS